MKFSKSISVSLFRVLQKNLVYVVGLSARVADPETLKKPEYFGKYGRILKVSPASAVSYHCKKIIEEFWCLCA